MQISAWNFTDFPSTRKTKAFASVWAMQETTWNSWTSWRKHSLGCWSWCENIFGTKFRSSKRDDNDRATSANCYVEAHKIFPSPCTTSSSAGGYVFDQRDKFEEEKKGKNFYLCFSLWKINERQGKREKFSAFFSETEKKKRLDADNFSLRTASSQGKVFSASLKTKYCLEVKGFWAGGIEEDNKRKVYLRLHSETVSASARQM